MWFINNIKNDVIHLYKILKHPKTKWYVKVIAWISIGYLFSPIQLIPNWIPIIGPIDDLLVIYLGLKLANKINKKEILKA